jgi:hypothetical protein
VILFVLIWIVSTIYLALALALCVVVLLAAYWAFTELPSRFSHGPDSAELRQREKREHELADKRKSSR